MGRGRNTRESDEVRDVERNRMKWDNERRENNK